MSVLAIALGAGIVVVMIVAGIRFQLKRARDKRFKGLELKPNCLLTRYPIIFIAKQQTLFRVFEDWDDIPKYLREHGYEVMILSPVPGFEVPSVVAAIDGLKSKCHLIAGGIHEKILHQIANAKNPHVASLTYVERNRKASKVERSNSISIHDLRPSVYAVETFEVVGSHHRDQAKPWALEDKFLDYAISLAERDAEWCD